MSQKNCPDYLLDSIEKIPDEEFLSGPGPKTFEIWVSSNLSKLDHYKDFYYLHNTHRLYYINTD